MSKSLDVLQLTDDERALASIVIAEAAYFKWLNAGCPPERDLEFWFEAEQEWIENQYVPHRYCEICDQIWDPSHMHFHQSA